MYFPHSTYPMKYFVSATLLFLGVSLCAQSHFEEVRRHQQHLNEEFRHPDESPLSEEDLANFDSLQFFPIDSRYRIVAHFIRNEEPATFQMKTTTERLPTYDRYGVAIFQWEGKEYRLTIYQSHSLRQKEEYKDYLFLPFTDLTNGEESYGGGRYLDLRIPEGDSIVINFNLAYNPYCAYQSKYSCPIPPQENFLNFRVEAGVKEGWD